MTDSLDLKKVAEQLGEIEGLLDTLNSQPSTAIKAEGVGDSAPTTTPARSLLSKADAFALRTELRKKSTAELYAMFDMQAAKSDTGVPFAAWAAAGGAPVTAALANNPMVTKALDSGSGSALIRQDLEPVMYELFVREFPAFERFPKEPANGLVHAFNQVTSFGDAQFMSELGTVTDDQSTYVRQTTNVAILATRRGVSLKSQFAAVQSGGGFNPENLEMQGGMRAVAHKMQKTIFQGNATDNAGTATNELGAFDPNGFDGLRKILDTGRAVNVDPTDDEDLRAAFDIAGLDAMNNGGTASILYLRPSEKVAFDLQQDKNVRYMNSWVDIAVGVQTNAVNTIFGPLPLAVIPGDAIGEYDTDDDSGSFTGTTRVADVYLLDERTITLPYLGSEGPTVLDIPIGISGQLTHLFIIFGMWGMAVKAPIFSNKIRIKQPA
jgi:hypothetical protein